MSSEGNDKIGLGIAMIGNVKEMKCSAKARWSYPRYQTAMQGEGIEMRTYGKESNRSGVATRNQAKVWKRQASTERKRNGKAWKRMAKALMGVASEKKSKAKIGDAEEKPCRDEISNGIALRCTEASRKGGEMSRVAMNCKGMAKFRPLSGAKVLPGIE